MLIFPMIFIIASSAASFPKPLSPKEEKELIEKKENGDTDAKNRLIEHNLRLAAHIAKKYSSSSAESEDLISIGTIGLIKAVNSFNSQKNTRLATYAARCIENEILMYLRWQKRFSSDLYLQDPLSCDKDGNEISLIDTVTEENTSVSEKAELNIFSDILLKGINTLLSPREKEIIILRYGLGKNDIYTQREIAKKLHISSSYVSRIEKKALCKLKECFA
mgnify:CR=1 FL=1